MAASMYILRYLACASVGAIAMYVVVAGLALLGVTFAGSSVAVILPLIFLPGFVSAWAYKKFYSQKDVEDILRMVVNIQDKQKEKDVGQKSI